VPFDEHVGSALRRAYELQVEGRSEEAIAALNRGLDGSPRSVILLEARGALYGALHYRRAAVRDFELITHLDPGHARAWFALGRMREELGLPYAALHDLGVALDLGLDDPEVHLVTARALRRLGHRTQAAAAYVRALVATEEPSAELLIEAATLAEEADGVCGDALARAKECWELELSDEAGLRDLLRRGRGQDPKVVLWHLEQGGIDRRELREWTRLALLALRFEDPVRPAPGAPMALGSSDGGPPEGDDAPVDER
jgi:tetratricopeptide (TPR) repeat protein